MSNETTITGFQIQYYKDLRNKIISGEITPQQYDINFHSKSQCINHINSILKP